MPDSQLSDGYMACEEIMNDIDKWTAEQCGVELTNDGMVISWPGFDAVIADVNLWTIKDPRCREKVRESFRIETVFIDDASGYGWISSNYIPWVPSLCKTIAEAEIACIKAIYEARK